MAGHLLCYCDDGLSHACLLSSEYHRIFSASLVLWSVSLDGPLVHSAYVLRYAMGSARHMVMQHVHGAAWQLLQAFADDGTRPSQQQAEQVHRMSDQDISHLQQPASHYVCILHAASTKLAEKSQDCMLTAVQQSV